MGPGGQTRVMAVPVTSCRGTPPWDLESMEFARASPSTSTDPSLTVTAVVQPPNRVAVEVRFLDRRAVDEQGSVPDLDDVTAESDGPLQYPFAVHR